MGDNIYGVLTVYVNVPYKDFQGDMKAKLCAITTERCTLQQARGLKADWKGMNGAAFIYRWRAEAEI